MHGTRVQILRDIETWTKDLEAPSILWLTGMAGTGKTAINMTICERADDDPDIVLGGSFFCSRSAGSIAQRDVRSVIPTLAQLLARQSAVFSLALDQELTRDPDILHKQVAKQVKQLLYKPLLSLQDSHIPILFVIDALDECGSLLTSDGTSDDTETHRMVSEMLEALVTFSRSSPKLPVKFMVTSRPETHIRETSVSDSTNEVLRLHTISKKQVTADIRLYISDKLSKSTRLRAWLNDSEADMLANLSDGLFIVAVTALNYALGPRTDRAAAQFKKLLEPSRDKIITEAVAPLDCMYALILENAARFEDLPEMLQLLAAILSAGMTLSITALADLLEWPIGHMRAALSQLHAVVDVPEDDSEPSLRTLHASFGDYLIGRAPDHLRISESVGHEVLAHACLQVMEKRLYFNVSQSQSSYFRNHSAQPATITLSLQYACLHWVYHISSLPEVNRPEEADTNSLRSRLMSWIPGNTPQPTMFGLDVKINDVMRPRLLFWLEVMSVLGKVRRAAAILVAATSAVQSPELAKFFRDAAMFVASSHDAIEQSAPHIYLSALPFSAKDSLIYKTFTPLCTGLISVDLFGVEHHGGQLVMSLTGHDGAVNSVSYSPSGRLIGSGGKDGTIRFWDMRIGEEVMIPLSGNDGPVWSVKFAPDGMSLVSGAEVGVACIWRLLGSNPAPRRLSGHTAAVISIAYSPDSSLIASASRDGTLRLWSTATAELRAELRGHTAAVNTVTFSSNSQLVVSGSSDGTVRIWHSRTGEATQQLVHETYTTILSIAISPDGEKIAANSTESDGIAIRRFHTGKVVKTLKSRSGGLQSLEFSPDGRSLASVDDKRVCLTDLSRHASDAFLTALGRHRERVRCVTFSPDGLYIASAAEDSTIRIWSSSGEGSAGTLSTPYHEAIKSVVVSYDGEVIVSGSHDCSVCIWDARTGEAKHPPLVGHTEAVQSVTISPDGHLIASASDDRTIRIWDVRTGKAVGRPLKLHTSMVLAVAFSSDGRWLASGSQDRTVHIWDVLKQRAWTLGTLYCSSSVHAVVFSPDGRIVAAGDAAGQVYLWRVENGQLASQPFGDAGKRLSAVAFSPDGAHIVTAGVDTVAYVWSASEGRKIFPLKGHTDWVRSAAYSRDGRHIGTGSHDHTVRLWNAATGSPIVTLHGHTGWVMSVAFAPDSKSIVSGSQDRAIRIFTVDSAASYSQNVGEAPISLLFSASDKNGWQLGPSGELLLWVPAAYRLHLRKLPCTLLIEECRMRISAGFSGWIHGVDWTSCWRGITSHLDFNEM